MNERRNITRHIDAMGERKEEGKKKGKKGGPLLSYLVKGSLPRVRRTNISRSPVPAACLGVKKSWREATEEEAEDQEIVGKRAIRFHYPSHRSSNFDAARNAQIYINLSP